MKWRSSLESEIILTKVAMPHHNVIYFCIRNGHWREAKRSNREEKEKFNILFSSFEKRKRNQKFLSLVLRGKREFQKNMLNFREEKEKWTFYAQASRRESENKISVFEKRKRNVKYCSLIMRRERETENRVS